MFTMPYGFWVCLMAYALGCVSPGYLFAWRKGVDLRAAGSGSTGARNAGRLLGPAAFALVFGADLFKGGLAVWLGGLGAADPWKVPVALLAVVAGHVWPLPLRFRGGRGISPAVGGLLFLSWKLTFLLAAPLLLGWALARDFPKGGMLAVLAAPLIAWFLRIPLGLSWQACAALILLAGMLIFTHARGRKGGNPSLDQAQRD